MDHVSFELRSQWRIQRELDGIETPEFWTKHPSYSNELWEEHYIAGLARSIAPISKPFKKTGSSPGSDWENVSTRFYSAAPTTRINVTGL